MVCPSSEKMCTGDDGGLYCSFGGVCMGADGGAGGSGGAGAAAALPPSASIVPVLTLNGPESIKLEPGKSYAPCAGAQTSGCELGATAMVNSTGDFNNRIKACEDKVGHRGSLFVCGTG